IPPPRGEGGRGGASARWGCRKQPQRPADTPHPHRDRFAVFPSPQRGREVGMKALTGNRLDDGEAIFLAPDGSWALRFADAELFESDDAALAAEARAKTQVTVVVDPYLIDVIASDDAWAPLSFRERVRALGPTNKPEHGKKTEGGESIAALLHAHGV